MNETFLLLNSYLEIMAIQLASVYITNNAKFKMFVPNSQSP